MNIYLIRHTEVAVGRSVAYGQSDVALAHTYEAQRDRLRTHLPANVAAIFSSPLSRCRRLAEDLAAGLPADPLAVQYDDRLKEFYFGDWELKPWAEIDRALLDPWMADFVTVRTPNGEHFGDVYERVGAFWREHIEPLAEAGSGKNVLIVSHGGTIRALLCLFLAVPLPNAYRLNLDYGAVSLLTRSGLTRSGATYTIQYINR